MDKSVIIEIERYRIMRKPIIVLIIVWTILITVMFKSCTRPKDSSIFNKNGSTSKMQNLNISVLHDRNISINLVQYRNVFEDDPTCEAEWKLLIFAEEVGFRNRNIVLVAQDFYLVDGDTLIHICPVSDQETTNDRIIPYLQSKIDRKTLMK